MTETSPTPASAAGVVPGFAPAAGVRVAPARVLVMVVLGLTAAGVLAIALPGGAALWIAAAALVAGAAVVDAAAGRVAMVRWEVSGPPRLNTGLGKRIAFAVHVRRPAGSGAARVRYGVETPAVLAADPEVAEVLLPAGGGTHALPVACVPDARGRHAVGALHVQAGSPWGLWDVRARFPSTTELRVHPDVASDRRSFAAAFHPRMAGGLRLQRQLGRGREFEKLREYLPGDGFDEIHWKATARRGHPVTKVFQIERTQEVHVVLDASRLSARPVPTPEGRERATLERQVSAALALAGLARRQGDRLGLVVHTDRVLRVLAAGSSAAHFNACRDVLTAVRTQDVSPDPREIFTHIAARLRRRALLVLLTDLSDAVVAEQFLAHLPLLARRHLVLVVQPQSPRLQPVFHGPEPRDAAGVVEALAWHAEWETVRGTLAALATVGARGLLAPGPEYVGQVLNRYMNLRREQIL